MSDCSVAQPTMLAHETEALWELASPRSPSATSSPRIASTYSTGVRKITAATTTGTRSASRALRSSR